MEGIRRGGLEERVGGEDGTDAVEFFDGEGVKWVVRGVRGVVVVVASGFVGLSEGFVLEAILESAP